MITDKNSLIRQGTDLRESGQFGESLEILKLAESDPSLKGTAFFEQAKVHLDMCNYRQAIELAEKALDLEPASVSINVFLGDTYLLDNNTDQAIKYLQDAVALQPDHDRAGQLLQRLYDRTSNFEAEHELLIELLPHFKNEMEFLYSYSIFMVERSPRRDELLIRESLGYLQALQVAGFTNEDLEFYLAKANFMLNDHDKCITHISRYLPDRRKQNRSAGTYAIIIRVDESIIALYKKHIPSLEKSGDKIFVTALDTSKSEQKGLDRGPIYKPGEKFYMDELKRYFVIK